MGDKTKGLYNKFNVTRTDGSDRDGGKHEGCDYFVLDLTHDKFAANALAAYADACAFEYPLLSAGLIAKLRHEDLEAAPQSEQEKEQKND